MAGAGSRRDEQPAGVRPGARPWLVRRLAARRRRGTVGCALPFAVLAGGIDGPQGLSWAMLLGGSASAVCAVAFVPVAAVVGALAALTATHAVGYLLAGADVARMREAGGAVEVDSAPGEGTRIALRWPA